VTHNSVGRTEGESDEVIIVGCHHDSPFRNAVEDSSGMAVVFSLAEKLAAGSRPRRTILFLATAGHFYGSIGTRTFIADHTERSLILCRSLEKLTESKGSLEAIARVQSAVVTYRQAGRAYALAKLADPNTVKPRQLDAAQAAYASLDERQRGMVDGEVAIVARTNLYDPASGTLTLPAGSTAASSLPDASVASERKVNLRICAALATERWDAEDATTDVMPSSSRAAQSAVRLARVEPGVIWPPSMPK